MPFGLSKKKDKDAEAEQESSRNRLFGGRKKEKESNSNPYAAADFQAPPPAYSSAPGSDQYSRDNKSPAVGGGRPAPRGYSGQGSGYGTQAGYGTQPDRYGSGPPAESTRRPGGYGGLGRTTSDDNDVGRDALFGNAPSRYQQAPAPGAPGAPGGYGQPGDFGGDQSGYGAYGDRQLTAEEQEEEDINATKSEIKFLKQQDVSSTRNALRLAEQAEMTGRDTLARLGAQGERLYNTEKNLDLASSQNRIAEEKARELKTLNKSMFAMHVSNPFNSENSREQKDKRVLETHALERDQRDLTRQQAWNSQNRNQTAQQGLQNTRSGGQKSTLADRAKYQFEADSEDDEMENEIDSNLDALHGAAKRLNGLSRAMGEEVATQNKHIDRVAEKTDKVDDQVLLNRNRLDRIR